MSHRTSALCLLLLALGFAVPGLEAQTLDQECDPVSLDHAYLLVPEREIDCPATSTGGELYQRFRPTAVALSLIELKIFVLQSVGVPDPTHIRVRILDENGDELSNSCLTFELGTTGGFPNAWVQVSYNPVVVFPQVGPGIFYTIAVSWQGWGTSLWWLGAGGDPYPDAGPGPGDKLPNADWAFRTYAP